MARWLVRPKQPKRGSLAKRLANYIVDEVADGFVVEASPFDLLRIRDDAKKFIASVEPYRYRDPIYVGDPTFAKVASRLEHSEREHHSNVISFGACDDNSHGGTL